MLNYFNFKEFKGQYLLTNDFGRYAFLIKDEFYHLLRDDMDLNGANRQKLTENLFIYDGSSEAFSAENRYLMRDSKNYVFTPTSLYIFVVTTACNMRCSYCQAHTANGTLPSYMDEKTAEKAVDIALSSPSNYLSFEFQGGEPLLNFKTIKHIVEYTESKCFNKEIKFSLVSNLTLLNDEIIQFIKEHHIGISTSIDGPLELHNINRPYAGGKGTYSDVRKAIQTLKNEGVSVGAIQTTTKESLRYPKEIVDIYYDLGVNSLFLRPLTPLGRAKERWEQIGYTAAEFSDFYREAILYLIKRNLAGDTLQEGHVTILSSKILHGYPANYMELRSPCGAVIGQMAFHVNGDVFTCDEGRMLYEMGNDYFKLGNVFSGSYDEFISSPACKATCGSSVLESIPSCCDCVYQPYCGICPVVNYALFGDILPKTPNDYRCTIYSGILDIIFGLLSENDSEIIRVLESWRT